jgi:diphthamide synthase (EF-2-diphthine--ammonia ligase)
LVRRIAFGDLYLADVRAYRERLLHDSGYAALFPLWGKNTKALALEFIASGFRAHLVCVDTQQLAGSFAGRLFDESLLAELPQSVDPCGENGEFHTFVSAGPSFSAELNVRVGEVVMRDERFAFCDLLSAVNSPATSRVV